MSEYTYLEQYTDLDHMIPRHLHDRLIELLKEVKNPKYERQIKDMHAFIDYFEKAGTKLSLYQKATLELLLINVEQMKQRERNEG